MSKQRIKYADVSRESFSGFLTVRDSVLQMGRIPQELIAMLELRVSYINGCSYCINMHFEELLNLNVPVRKIREIAAWQCSHQFEEKDKAAFVWADSLTNITKTHVSDKDFECIKKYFLDEEISDMTMIVSNMNAMNRIAIAMRSWSYNGGKT